ncbi:hypothetical protein ACH47Z_39475 [Streptomyces sp. NPDC020192]|uniref:hypothetical protein n=1 Tax=Streptomyces sp. NPDC020192 TaxID=3365066 RepID=UPI00378A4D8B
MIDRPQLLTSVRHEAPTPAILRFIGELVTGGAPVVRLACPRCHGVKALSKLLDGRRICRACFAKHAAVPCARCGAVREPATRDADGQPLCPNCLIRDPLNLEVCVGCARRQPVAVRLAGVRPYVRRRGAGDLRWREVQDAVLRPSVSPSGSGGRAGQDFHLAGVE